MHRQWRLMAAWANGCCVGALNKRLAMRRRLWLSRSYSALWPAVHQDGCTICGGMPNSCEASIEAAKPNATDTFVAKST